MGDILTITTIQLYKIRHLSNIQKKWRSRSKRLNANHNGSNLSRKSIFEFHKYRVKHCKNNILLKSCFAVNITVLTNCLQNNWIAFTLLPLFISCIMQLMRRGSNGGDHRGQNFKWRAWTPWPLLEPPLFAWWTVSYQARADDEAKLNYITVATCQYKR